jgi:hypothetical protein
MYTKTIIRLRLRDYGEYSPRLRLGEYSPVITSPVRLRRIIVNYYMASITSGEMADCDWLRSTFSSPLFSHYVKTNACILKQNSKTD